MITWKGLSLTYGKEKTRTQTTHTCMHTHTDTQFCAVVKGVYYGRGGEGIDEPQELPGQPM